MSARATAFTSLAFIVVIGLMCGCASRPRNVPPTTGPEFPRSDSYYPSRAQELGQEGTTTVRYCVEANGHLVEAPSVGQSSGNDELDEAALKLARDGDGNYRPAYENGRPLAGCAAFHVKFQLRIDPRFPILSRRANELTAELRPESERLEAQLKGIEPPPSLTASMVGDPEQMNRLRRFADGTTPLIKQYAGELSKLIERTDELGRADDVTESERTAFSTVWQLKRADIAQMREAVLDMQGLLATIDELISYVQNSQPPLSGSSGPTEPSPRQRANVDLIIGRGRTTYSTLEPLLREIQHHQSEAAGQPHSVARETAAQVAVGKSGTSAIELLSVEGEQYSAASMPDVRPPRTLTDPNDEAVACKYPELAIRNSEEGTTIVRLQIDVAGRATGTSVVRSSGYDELDSAALNCLNRRQFNPAMRGVVPVASVARYTMSWKIDWGLPNAKSCRDIEAGARKRPFVAPGERATDMAVICTCFEESGKPRQPELVRSTGSSRLDHSAIALATQAGTRPRPPGHPGCFAFRMKFELRDEPDAVPKKN